MSKLAQVIYLPLVFSQYEDELEFLDNVQREMRGSYSLIEVQSKNGYEAALRKQELNKKLKSFIEVVDGESN